MSKSILPKCICNNEHFLKVHSNLVSFFIDMTLNIIASFDVKKPEHSPNLSLNLFSSKSIFSFFIQTNGPNNVECHMYKVPK